MKKLLFFFLLTMMTSAVVRAQVISLDFESAEKSTTFSYFDNGEFTEPQTKVVANPDKSGINTSDNVLEMTRGAGSKTWAGAYGNPKPAIPFDFTTDNRLVCKFWAAHVGNLQLKLEGGPAGGADNWEKVVPVNVANQWVEVEFDVTLPSDVAGGPVAFGKVYDNLVIFLDFGLECTETFTCYLDDIGTKVGEAAEPEPVTFVLNASSFSGTISSVSVAGTFNNWDAAATPMSEVSAGSKLYTVTTDVLPGIIEYKFVINGSTWEEGLSPLDECVTNNGGFVNRKASISGETNLNPVCWNKCYNCGEDVDITINVGFGAANPPSPDGIWIAGGSRFEAPGGKYKLEDPDSDGLYTIQLNRGIGFFSHFTLTNGNCPDYSCKEQLEGQDCGDPNNYNDRRLQPVTQDTVMTMCFGDCSGASCVASSNVLKDAGFSISPNPALSTITLRFDNYLQQRGVVTITNIFGAEVKRAIYQPGTNQLIIEVGHLAPGMYTASYLKDGKVGTKLFIKN